jgi:hypothetical protein
VLAARLLLRVFPLPRSGPFDKLPGLFTVIAIARQPSRSTDQRGEDIQGTVVLGGVVRGWRHVLCRLPATQQFLATKIATIRATW